MDHRNTKPLVNLIRVLLLMGVIFVSTDSNADKVVIAKSSSLPAYEKVVKSFEDATDFKVVCFELSDSKKTNDKVLKQIWHENPDLIVALGSRSLALVAENFPGVPKVFGLAASGYAGSDSKTIPGILLLPSPEQMLNSIRLVIPDVRRVAVIFDASAVISGYEYRWQKRYGNISVIMVGLNQETEWDSRIGELHGKVDVAILELSGRLVSRDFIKLVLEKAVDMRLPIATYSAAVVEMGALLAVEPNLESVGAYLAKMTRFVIEGASDELGIRPPPHTRLIINLSIAQSLGIPIPQTIQENALIVGK